MSNGTPPTPTPLEPKEAIEQQWRVYLLIQDLIKFADTKAGAILTADSVLIGVTLSLLKDRSKTANLAELTIFTSVLALLAFGISASQCISCILPRRDGGNSSRVFFQHIAQRPEYISPESPPTSYYIVMQDETQAMRLEDLNRQIWHVARHCETKYDYVNVAIYAAGFGLLFTVIAALLTIFS